MNAQSTGTAPSRSLASSAGRAVISSAPPPCRRGSSTASRPARSARMVASPFCASLRPATWYFTPKNCQTERKKKKNHRFPWISPSSPSRCSWTGSTMFRSTKSRNSPSKSAYFLPFDAIFFPSFPFLLFFFFTIFCARHARQIKEICLSPNQPCWFFNTARLSFELAHFKKKIFFSLFVVFLSFLLCPPCSELCFISRVKLCGRPCQVVRLSIKRKRKYFSRIHPPLSSPQSKDPRASSRSDGVRLSGPSNAHKMASYIG